MIRFLCAGIVLLSCSLSAMAQDGFYFSFSAGEKLVDVKDLNEGLGTLNSPSKNVDFPANNTVFGGEGHFLLWKRLVIGGKGMMFSTKKEIPIFRGSETKQYPALLSGTMCSGSLGFVVYSSDNGLRVYPQVGVGKSTLNLEVNSNSQYDIMTDLGIGSDSTVLFHKTGLVVDAGIGMEWYLKTFTIQSLFSGLDAGFLFHGELGYSFNPTKLKWMRGSIAMDDTKPDLKFTGFYFSGGIGFGFSQPK